MLTFHRRRNGLWRDEMAVQMSASGLKVGKKHDGNYKSKQMRSNDRLGVSFVSSTSREKSEFAGRRRSVIYHVPFIAQALLRKLFVSRRLLKRDKSHPHRFHPTRFIAIICLQDTNC